MGKRAWRKLVVIGAAAVLLSGCVTTRWVKPGATQSEMDRDWQECSYEVERAFAGVNSRAIQGLGLQYEKVQLFKQCITLRGFVEQQVRN